MKWLLIAVIALILFFILIMATKLKVLFSFYHGNDNDHLKIQFKAWFGLIRYKIEVPLIKVDDNSPTLVVKEKTAAGPQEDTANKDTKQFSAKDLINSMHDTKEVFNHIVSLHKIIRNFLSHVTIRKLEWHTFAGIGDAAHTGMLTGALWAVKGSIIGLVSHYMKLKAPPSITITPHFQFAVSQTAISCMIHFRVGHAMLAGIKLIKFWKGGRPDFKSKPLSALSDDGTQSV
ncbi:DUF2953 domain-containing protein [Cytobacillus sp. NCCP-133]|uniref:DUF2953 domain-containing protein n=1 Tax=Cytobacillus sp. NCCP-133 TaxID=766848 RepID=UPI002231227D|nr:DUF2953 domain-containing protein [Cytobacillus sp. NCCP-133]GLB58507.1 hypothetical protein NCCP133_06400 [Cytobacillus sp. NCCP-133]